MAAETLKEWIVSLGWDAEEYAHDKLTKAIEGATLRAHLMADGLEAAARRIAEGVGHAGVAYDKLFYAAERMHTSVAQIQKFEYAISQVGGTAEDALATMELLAASYQKDHGNIKLLQHFGWDIDQKTHQLKWSLETLKKSNILTEDDSQTVAYGAMLGMSQAQSMRFKQHPYDIDKFQKEQEAANARMGFDPDDAAKKADDFETELTRFIMLVGGIWDQFNLKFYEHLTKPLESFNTFLTQNDGAISGILNAFAESIGKVVTDIDRMFRTWAENKQSKEQVAEFFKLLRDGILGLSIFLSWSFKALALVGRVESGEWWKNVKKRNRFSIKKVEPGEEGDDGGFKIHVDPPFSEEGVIKSDGVKVGTGNPLPIKIDELSEDGMVDPGGGIISRAYNYMKGALGLGEPGAGGGAYTGPGHEGPFAAHNLGAGLKTKGGDEGSVDLSHVSPDMITRYKAMMEAAPKEVRDASWITSGYRSVALQAILYNRFLHGGPLAAAPGHSNHNRGHALDVHDPTGWIHRNANRFGLGFPLGKKDWPHMQMIGPSREVPAEKKPETPAPGSDKTSRLNPGDYTKGASTFAMARPSALEATVARPKIYNQEVTVHVDGTGDPAAVSHAVGHSVRRLAGDLTKVYEKAVG